MGKKYVSPLGTVAWSAVITPRENLSKRLEYSLGLVVNSNETEAILGQIQQLLAAAAQSNPKFTQTEGLQLPIKASYEKDEAGNKISQPDKTVLSFKRGAYRRARNGGTETPNDKPRLIDCFGKPYTQAITDVPSGSTVKVIYEPYTYDVAGNHGVGFDLCGVQIAELAEDFPELGAIEGYANKALTDQCEAPAQATPAQAPSVLDMLRSQGAVE